MADYSTPTRTPHKHPATCLDNLAGHDMCEGFEIAQALSAEVPEQTARHLLAVLREALSNAARHAHATGLEVGLAVDGVTATLTVTDDGLGIAPGGRRSGLENLRERAAQLGGTFTAQPGAIAGTVLVWKVPLRLSDAAGRPSAVGYGIEVP